MGSDAVPALVPHVAKAAAKNGRRGLAPRGDHPALLVVQARTLMHREILAHRETDLFAERS